MAGQGISRRRNDASRKYQGERNAEAAQRLRLLANIIYGEDFPDNPVKGVASYIDGTSPDMHRLDDTMRFMLGLVVDLILNDAPNARPIPIQPEILRTETTP